MVEHDVGSMAMIRETDRWLRKWSLIAPVAAYILGNMTGFAAAAWMFHDHEKRIVRIENWKDQHDDKDKEVSKDQNARFHVIEGRQTRVVQVLEDKFRVKIP